MSLLKWLFSYEGRIARGPYILAGTSFTITKYIIDRVVAAQFGQPWHLSNYFIPSLELSPFQLGQKEPELYATLCAIAIPFFWIGVALTLKRLEDSGHSPRWVFLFFVPYINLALFAWMSLAPTSLSIRPEYAPPPGINRRGASYVISVFSGLAAIVMLGSLLVWLGTSYLHDYGWGLFLGVPFVTGFISSWFLNFRSPHSTRATIGWTIFATLLLGLALIGFKIEGVICLLMAFPLSLPFSISGALFARYMLGCSARRSPSTFAACLAIVPLAMFGEHAANLEPPVIAVKTSVVINAPVSTVWRNVIAFPPLTPPDEWIFHTGIAYPTSAEIVGSGLGAIRYCRFSTGDFVEPITVWDENHLLAFDVSAQPQSMRELSPWKLTTPHLEHNYMHSRHGQFRLVALTDHQTLLEGTTWYQNYFWPQPYWRAWSDSIVHRIHKRVLQHVKELSEAPPYLP